MFKQILKIETIQQVCEDYEFRFICPDDVVRTKIIQDLINSDKEKFLCFHLDSASFVNGYQVISTGSNNASMVVPREVYKSAILSNAVSVIFVHNHPSNHKEVNPSADDIAMTRRLINAGKILGFRVLDHIVVSRNGHFSFSKENLL